MRIAVVGVGLIGGSIALAARERLGAAVAGFDPDREALGKALSRGALDETAPDLAGAVEGAEAVFVAVPVGALPGTVAAVLRACGPDCVVSDVGSTKRSIVAAVDDPRFVGGHPLAGAETSGAEHARADLFEGATWYLTPVAITSGLLYERLHRLLRGLGARPAAIEPETHDAILAAVSHLPHVLANTLVGQATDALSSGSGGERLPATGPSFRDATRVAGASSAIWTDIYLSNADALIAHIDGAVARLEQIREALRSADAEWVTSWNDRAAHDRARLIETQLGSSAPFEVRASVPNRPGVVAQLALELGRAGLNIVDLAVHPAPDMSEGVIALWLAGEDEAQRAAALIRGLGYPAVLA
jgi:prephenate dehydrogenase